MLEKKDIGKEFLNKFTKEIIITIKQSIEINNKEKTEETRLRKAVEIEKLKNKFSEYKKESQERIKELIKTPLMPPILKPQMPIKSMPTPIQKTSQLSQLYARQQIKPKPTQQLPITKIALPQTTSNLQGDIYFGQIIALVRDPSITDIECPGEGKNIMIKKMGGLVKTQLTLNKTEIIKIISSFSEKARIPLIEGMLKARINNLEISAITSEVSTPSFILKKISVPQPMQPTQFSYRTIPFQQRQITNL